MADVQLTPEQAASFQSQIGNIKSEIGSLPPLPPTNGNQNQQNPQTPPAPAGPASTPTPGKYDGFFNTTTKPGAGLDPNSFTSLLGQVGNTLEYNNNLTTQRQLLMKHLYDSPLTPDETAQLPKDMQDIVGQGKDAVELQIRVLNDQLQGRANSLSSSIQSLTTGYTQAQTNAKNAMNEILAYAQSTGQPIDKVAKALAPLYGVQITDQMLSNLKALGAPLLKTNQQTPVYGVYGTATNNVSTTLGVDPNTPLSQVVSDPTSLNSLVDAMIKNEGSSPKGVMNNPGNIKYTGLPGQIDSKVQATDGGTFASYSSSEAGKKAIADLITNAANGNSTAYGVAPTLGAFVDTYTNTAPTNSQFAAAAPDASIGNKVDPNTGITYNGMYQAALSYAYEGKMPSLGLGSGSQVKNARNAIISTAGAIAAGLGVDEYQLQALYKANASATKQSVERLARVESVASALVKNTPRIVDLANKVQAEGVSISESDLQLTQAQILRKFGSTDAASYLELIQTIRSDYSSAQAALAGSRGGTFFSQAANDAIPVGLTGAQYQAISDTIVTSSQKAKEAINGEVQDLIGTSGSVNNPSNGSEDLKAQVAAKGYNYDKMISDGHTDAEIKSALGL